MDDNSFRAKVKLSYPYWETANEQAVRMAARFFADKGIPIIYDGLQLGLIDKNIRITSMLLKCKEFELHLSEDRVIKNLQEAIDERMSFLWT